MTSGHRRHRVWRLACKVQLTYCVFVASGNLLKSWVLAQPPGLPEIQAVIKSAASATSPQGGRASGQPDHRLLFAVLGCASGPKNKQNLGLWVKKRAVQTAACWRSLGEVETERRPGPAGCRKRQLNYILGGPGQWRHRTEPYRNPYIRSKKAIFLSFFIGGIVQSPVGIPT